MLYFCNKLKEKTFLSWLNRLIPRNVYRLNFYELNVSRNATFPRQRLSRDRAATNDTLYRTVRNWVVDCKLNKLCKCTRYAVASAYFAADGTVQRLIP